MASLKDEDACRQHKKKCAGAGMLPVLSAVLQILKPDAVLITDTFSYQGLAFEYAGHATVNQLNSWKQHLGSMNTEDGFV